MASRSSASKKRKVGSTSRTVPIQFDTEKFVGSKQATRYVALEKRKIFPEKRFIINPEGTYWTFVGLIHSKKWDRLISPLEHYDIEIVREFYANALPNDDEPFTWTTRVSGRTVAFDRDAINRVLVNRSIWEPMRGTHTIGIWGFTGIPILFLPPYYLKGNQLSWTHPGFRWDTIGRTWFPWLNWSLCWFWQI